MALIENAELWFAKVHPKRPNKKFNKDNPTWEVQLRTTDVEQKKEWEALGLPVKAILPDEGEPYWKVNLKKRIIKKDGDPASPVEVVNGALQPVDPMSIGNGSRGNVRVYQYEYDKAGGGTGIATVLMGIQLTKHIVYIPRAKDDEFSETETETIDAEVEEEGEEEGVEQEEGEQKAPEKPKSKAPSLKKEKDKFD